jgi:hypothetical protein
MAAPPPAQNSLSPSASGGSVGNPALWAGNHAERDVLEGTLAGVVKMLSDVLGMVAPEALGRGQRLRDCMHRFARHVGAEPEWELEIASLLSTVGCAAVPLSIMRKYSSGADLNPAECAILERVPQIGYELISDIPRMTEIARVVLYQNKRFDGRGFPQDEVAGEDIPLGARMLKILHDRMDLEADGIVKQQALKAMKERAGAYDPTLLEQNFVCFASFLSTAISGDRQVLTLPVAQLQAGQVVVSDIVAHSGHTLVGAGNRLTLMTLERLRNFSEIDEVKEPVFVQDGA